MTSIYLASKSPRRKELLSQMGVDFDVLAINDHTLGAFDGDEVQHEGEAPQDYVVRTAQDKARAVLKLIQDKNLPPRPVLSADTTVIVNGKILGKPEDKTQAMQFLHQMSNTVHEVRTAVVLAIDEQHLYTLVSVSKVWFSQLTQEQIHAYADSDEPYDKAGGYGIQGSAAAFIHRIEGSYSGIMGLPVFETARLLEKIGYRFPN